MGVRVAMIDDLELRLRAAQQAYDRLRERSGRSRELDFVGVYLRRALGECERERAGGAGEPAEAPVH